MALNWQQISEDYAQKYDKTWGWVTITGKERELFYLENVEFTGKEPFLHLRNNKNGEILLRYDTENEIEFPYPEQGVHQMDKYTVVFFRHYIRQFKKGLCNQTGSIYPPYGQFIPWEPMWKEENLTKLFQKTSNVYYKDAIGLLKHDHLSVRLDNRFSLGLNVTKDKGIYILWYLDMPVGYVDYQGKLNLKETQFDQEWRDYLNRCGYRHGYYL